MTPTTKRTVRLSSDRANGRGIAVIVGPGALIGFRLKGTRREWSTTVRACYDMAIKQTVSYELAAKKRAKKARAA